MHGKPEPNLTDEQKAEARKFQRQEARKDTRDSLIALGAIAALLPTPAGPVVALALPAALMHTCISGMRSL